MAMTYVALLASALASALALKIGHDVEVAMQEGTASSQHVMFLGGPKEQKPLEPTATMTVFRHNRSQAEGEGRAERAHNCLPPGFRAATVHNEGNPFSMAVLTRRDIVSQSIVDKGSWEVHGIQEIVSRASVKIPASGTFLDIGANLGYYSLMFAKKGYHVIAVEPGSQNRMAIQASLCMNPEIAGLVTLVPDALTNQQEARNTRCVLRTTNVAINIGNMMLLCGATTQPCAPGEQGCEDVPLKTLDSLLAELKPQSIDAVKIDIEGHECQVLEGGSSLFTRYAPRLLQVETNVGHGAECVREASTKFSYQMRAISDADSVMTKHVSML